VSRAHLLRLDTACPEFCLSALALGGTTTREGALMNTRYDLPPIMLATSDYNDLLITAVFASRSAESNAGFLLSELMRASVCHPDDLPDDVVSTNCHVIYRIDGKPERHACLLVHPKDLLFPGAELSVTTPLGTALLGLRVGDRMRYGASNGQSGHEVIVEGIGMRFLHEDVPRRDFRSATRELRTSSAQALC
jgi:regulator of nucleoside diphosphate kinase